MNGRINSLDVFKGRVALGNVAFDKVMSFWISNAQLQVTVFFTRIKFFWKT
jgi:hypothetical protein